MGGFRFLYWAEKVNLKIRYFLFRINVPPQLTASGSMLTKVNRTSARRVVTSSLNVDVI